MPYRQVSDLPEARTEQYDKTLKDDFLKAFDDVFERYGHDERRAFADERHEAKQAGKKESAS
jgi:cation transport regulator ChaB